jgi:uncharacterized cupin superfamily protein
MSSILVEHDKVRTKELDRCHGGAGVLRCREYLADYKRTLGFAYVHDDVLPPGASIGDHTHAKDEELYFILAGNGVMRVDGTDRNVSAGDMVLTRRGGSHSLANTGKEPLRVLVVCARVGEAE